MYKLKNLNNGFYQIHSSRHSNAYEGTPVSVFRMAVNMGLPERELSVAVNTLHQLGHDYATFDYTGKFIKTGKNRGEGGPHGYGWH